jgi:exodeoxyribonuclease V gamma subunit
MRELLDYIDQHYRVAAGDAAERLSERLTTLHPLQPFSPSNFLVGKGSYDGYWCEVANTLRRAPTQDPGQVPAWNGARLSEPPERLQEVELVQLDRFLRHPVKYFVNSRLRVYLHEEAAEEDEELFALDGLQSFLLMQRLVEGRLQGGALSRRQLSAEGVLPHGAFAELVFEEESERVAPLVEQMAAYLGGQPGQISVDLAFAGDSGPRRLSGQINGVYPQFGLLRWTPGSLKGADILSLWLAHLAWCAMGVAGEKRSVLYSKAESFVIRETLDPESARAQLVRLLAWHWEGLYRPLPVLPKASYAYALGQHRGGRADPMGAARKAWEGNGYLRIPGDKDDPYLRLVLRGVGGEPFGSADFSTLADEFYGQVLARGVLS